MRPVHLLSQSPAALSRRGFVAAAGSLALAACAGAETLPAPPAASSRRSVVVEGVPIAYEVSGSGHPVALVHGASGNLNDMTFRLAPALAKSHTVIVFDRPGMGLSGWPATGGETLSTQARLLRGAMAQVGIPRATLVGHSYGGSVALAWALDAPETVDALLLLSAPTQSWEGGLGLSTSILANGLTGPLVSNALAHLVTAGFARSAADSVFAPQTTPEGYVAHLDLALVLQPASLRRNARQFDALKAELEARVPLYPRLAMPVALLHGEADTTVGLEIHAVPFARALPSAPLTRQPGIGHMPHQVALPAVLDAFAALEARRA